MRVLVVTLPEKGHYLPLLGPAQALEARGVEVLWAAGADISAELRELGVERLLTPPGAPPPSDALRGELLAEVIADPEELARWIRLLLVDAPREGVDSMRRIVRDAKPDVVAIDTMAYDGAVAAELEGVPWVGWATSLNPVIPDDFDSALIRTTRALDDERRALFEERGLVAPPFRVSDALSPRGTATFTTERLVGAPPETVSLVGPSIRPPGPPLDSPRAAPPLIYVSFGSQAWHQPARYRAIVEATRSLEVELLMAMGDLAATLGPELERHEHVRCVSAAPQLRVLERAATIVTHGGANSVMEALHQGVPPLIAPLCNDQPHNLRFVERARAGRGVDLETATPDAITEALAALLAEGEERHNASAIAASYRERSGSEGAAELALSAAR